MSNSELLKEVTNLKDYVEIKERIEAIEIGDELDETFSLELLNMRKTDEPQEVEISPSNKVETHFVDIETGEPVFLPNVSTDNNLAVLVMKELQQDFNFEYSDNKFKVPYEDKGVFVGHTIGEAVMKALLFGKAIQKSGVL